MSFIRPGGTSWYQAVIPNRSGPPLSALVCPCPRNRVGRTCFLHPIQDLQAVRTLFRAEAETDIVAWTESSLYLEIFKIAWSLLISELCGAPKHRAWKINPARSQRPVTRPSAQAQEPGRQSPSPLQRH